MIIIILSGRTLQQFDLGFLVGLIDGLDELVLEDAFVDDVLDAQDDVEGDAVFAELFVAHGWLEAGDAVLAVREDVARGLEGDALDLLEVAAVGDGQRDGDRALGQGLLVVHQGRGGDALVRHDDHIAGRGPERRIVKVCTL